MQHHRFIRLAIALFALAALTAACGGKTKIGEGLKADGTPQGGQGAIQQATTTTAPIVVTTAPVTTTKANTPTTAAQPSVIFKIQDDNKGQYIDPLRHTVRAGQLVRFVNEDDSAHTISGKIGSTLVMGPSPSIAPGGTWDVRPTVKGTYDIVDEQRPYAAGVTLTVQ